MNSTAHSPAPHLESPAPSIEADVDEVVAIVVTFHPDFARFALLLEAVLPQVQRVLIVDNHDHNDSENATWPVEGPWDSPRVQRLRQTENIGLAAAQNIGLQAARALHARWLLLLDQDSVPHPDMVRELLQTHRQATADGLHVGVAGPAIIDPSGHSEGFVRFRDGRYVAVKASPAERWIDCDLLIASGSLIPRAVFEAVGPMDERLFIDKIDTDWSLRVAACGYTLIGVPAARLHHQLGERFVKVWFLRWRELSLHKPFRYYYIVRNSRLLRRMPHAHAAWRRADARQLMSIVLYFGLLAPGRWAALRMMWRGWRDGARSVTGPLR